MTRRLLGLAVLLLLLAPSPADAQPADRLAGVGLLLVAHKEEEAACRVQETLEAYRSEGDRQHEAICQLLLGLMEMSRNHPDTARTRLITAIDGLEKAADRFGSWLARWSLAQLENQEGQIDVSIAQYERALAVLHDAAASQEPLSFESFKIMASFFGASPEMLGPMSSMPEIMKPFLLAFAESVSRDGYASALIEDSRLDRAAEELTGALRTGAMFGGLFDSSIYAHLGELRRRQWRFDEAKDSYLKALAGAKTMSVLAVRDEFLEVKIFGELAEIELLRGRVDEALAWNDKALAFVREVHNTRREASLLDDRASLLMHASRFDAAENVLAQALTVSEKDDDPYGQALILSTTGALHMMLGRYGSAARYLERSLERFQKVHNPYVEAPVWSTLATVYMLLDADDSANAALERGIALAKKSDFRAAEAMLVMQQGVQNKLSPADRLDLMTTGVANLLASHDMKSVVMITPDTERMLAATAAFPVGGSPGIPIPHADSIASPGVPIMELLGYLTEGRMLLQSGKPAAAREVWTRALTKNPNRDLRAALLAGISLTYWAEGKADEAAQALSASADALERSLDDIRTEELLASYAGGGRRVYFELLVEMLLRQGKVEEAFGVSERARTRAFLQLLGNHRLHAAPGRDSALLSEAEILRTEFVRLEHQGHGGARADEELAHARTRYQSVMERVKASSPEYASITHVEPLSIDAVRASLPPDTTIVSYFVTPYAVHAWIVDRSTVAHVSLAVGPERLERAVCWADHLGHRAAMARGTTPEGSICDHPPAAEDVYTMLVAPLRDRIRGTRLIVVPHGVLHYVPFAALRDPETNRYLVQDYTITYAPSASTLPFLRAKESPVDGKALVLGDPNGTLPKLPGAKQEALAVAQSLGTTARTGPDATEDTLFQLHGVVDLLHIAAHGHYDARNPLFSYLDLTPGNGRDGKLEVHEILSDLDLSGVNLVVLSACESALGKRSGGDEIVGLTRAFLYAGTPGLISTLWSIPDEPTPRLMSHFYAKLLDGESAAEALRDAQLAMLGSSLDADRDPGSWAAFVLTGDPQGRWTSVHPGPGRKP